MSYTPAEIEAFAARQKCSVEEFKSRWIVVYNGACFIHGPNGYRAPIKNQLDIDIAIRKWLSPVPTGAQSKAGIDWTIPWGQGEKDKPTNRLITEYGSLAVNHILSTCIEHSYYDAATETFYERICPLRKLEPQRDEQIDHWLRLIGGEHPETLLDWVATCPDLTRATCAIFLHAPPDCGKTLLAEGIARLWGQMPTPFDSAISNFNSAVLNCPLVFADEQIPRDISSGTIRLFISSLSRPIKRKNKDEGSMLGALRLIIAANSPDILRFDKEEFQLEDIQAIGERILYFKCSPEAATYLKSLGGFTGTADWVTGDRIAKHVLWLAQTRQVLKSNRFLIKGGVDVIHRSLATKGFTRERTVEWICAAMREKWQTPNPGIRFGNGELFINAKFVQETWEALLKDPKIPSLQRIGQAFRPLSTGERRFYIGPRTKESQRRADFFRIDPRFIYDNVKGLQIGTEEEFRALIDRTVGEDDGSGDGGPGGTVIPINGHSNGHTNGHTNGHVNGHAGSGLFDIHSEIDFFSPENPAVLSLFDRLKD